MENAMSVVLYCTQGRSDKVYQVQLQNTPPSRNDPYGDDWVVNFQYGRRGSSLRSGTKTPQPLEYYAARNLADKLIRSKLAKGYTQSESGVTYIHSSDVGKYTTFKPQLLNQVTEEEALALWGTIDMYMQTKHDGERRGIVYSPNGIIPANRKGLKVDIADRVQTQMETWHGASRNEGILDCEDMGDYLVCFDVIQDHAKDQIFSDRAMNLGLAQMQAHELNLTDIVFDIPFKPESLEDMRAFINEAKLTQEEGVVIRDGAGIYEPGKPNSGGPAWKLKFYEDATCRVKERHPVKRSIRLELWHTGYGESGWIDVGNCTIPSNHPFPDPGDLVEIRYLYAYKGGSLYQPVYKGVRTDVGLDAAVTTQLKYKQE